MKKFLYVLVCLLLLAGIGGSAYLLKGGNQGKDTNDIGIVLMRNSVWRIGSSFPWRETRSVE